MSECGMNYLEITARKVLATDGIACDFCTKSMGGPWCHVCTAVDEVELIVERLRAECGSALEEIQKD
jgi:hypothetical protein